MTKGNGMLGWMKSSLTLSIARLSVLSVLVLSTGACSKASQKAADENSKKEKTSKESAASSDDESTANKKKAANLPKAADLLAAHVEASGGLEKINAIETLYMEGKMDTGSQGVKALSKLWWKKGKFYLEEPTEGIGVLKAGYDGKTVWSEDPIYGRRKLSGKEAEQHLRNGALFLCAHWKKHFQSAETTGEAQVEGRKAYKVELKSKLASSTSMYFDAENKLLVKLETKQITPSGDIPFETKLEEYKSVGGVLMPHLHRSRIPPIIKVTQRIDKVEVGVEIPDTKFAYPDEQVSDSGVPAREKVNADPQKQIAAEQ